MSPPNTAALPLLVTLGALLLGGCGFDAGRIPGIYRIDIQQGNVVTQDMLDRLEPGMDKRRVRFILGTPLIADTFNDDRWDYLYSFQKGGGERVQRRISVHFAEERLVRLDGDLEPAAQRRAPVVRPETVVTVPPRADDGGFLSAMTPSFLKRKEGITETATGTSTPSALEEPLSAPQPAVAVDAPATASAAPAAAASTPPPPPPEVATAPPPAPRASPPAGPTATDADSETLKDLFRGFGTGTVEARAGETAPDDADAAAARPDAEADDQGFFDRLMRRFRRATGTAAPAAEPASAPAAQ